jgi:hypothetical protein
MSKAYVEQTEAGPEIGNVKIPKKVYKFRVLPDTRFSMSKTSGNPMVTLVSEVIEPEVVIDKASGTSVKVGGKRCIDYLVLTDKGAAKVRAACSAIGVETPDDENPDVESWFGLTFDAYAGTTAEDTIDETTGEPVVNPNTQEKTIRHTMKVFEYYAAKKGN